MYSPIPHFLCLRNVFFLIELAPKTRKNFNGILFKNSAKLQAAQLLFQCIYLINIQRSEHFVVLLMLAMT